MAGRAQSIWDAIMGRVNPRQTPYATQYEKITKATYADITNLVPINAAVSNVRDSIVALPIELQDRDKGIVESHRVLDLLNRPNALQTKGDLIGQIISEMIIFGNAFVFYDESRLICLEGNSNRVIVNVNEARRPVYTVTGSTVSGAITIGPNQSVTINHTNMMHFKRNSKHGLTGSGILETLEAEMIILKYLNRKNTIYAQGNNKQYVYSSLDTPEVARKTADKLTKALLRKTATTIAIGKDETIIPLQVNGEDDIKSDRLLQVTINSIASDIKLPASFIGSDAAEKYNNYLIKKRGYLEGTLQPMTISIAEVFNRHFFPLDNYKLVFNTDDFLKGDFLGEVGVYINLLDAGAISANELRDALNFPPIDGDEFNIPRIGRSIIQMTPPSNGGADGPQGGDNVDPPAEE